MSKHRFLILALLAALGLMLAVSIIGAPSALAAATPTDESTNAGPPAPAWYAPYLAHVGMYDNFFWPCVIFVRRGTTVTWTNHGMHHHTVTSGFPMRPGEGMLFDSGDIMPNQSYSHTFTMPGRYYYFCRHHQPYMRGVVIVW